MLESMYANKLDLDPNNLAGELFQFQSSISSLEKSHWPTQIYRRHHMHFKMRKLASNFFTLPVINCSSERSFLSLKRIKNRLQSTLDRQNLNALGTLSIDIDMITNLNFDDIISAFRTKSEKKIVNMYNKFDLSFIEVYKYN